MKRSENSKLFIGLGVGLLVGAAAAVYFTTSDKERREFVDDISDAVHRAKKNIKRAVHEGVEELDEAAEKMSKMAKQTINKAKHEIHHHR